MVKEISVKSTEDLENLFQEYINTFEIIFFKFSPICPISTHVEAKFNKWMKTLPVSVKLVLVKIDVIYNRTLSNAISNGFNIKHESPQVIWIDTEGSLKWHDSHYAISESNLNRHLNKKSK